MDSKYESVNSLLPVRVVLSIISAILIVVLTFIFVPSQIMVVFGLAILLVALAGWRAFLKFPLRPAESYTLADSSLVMESRGMRTEVPYANIIDAVYIKNFGLTTWAEVGIARAPYFYRHFTPGGFEPYGILLKKRRGGAGVPPDKENIVIPTNLAISPGGAPTTQWPQLPSMWYLAPKEPKKFFDDLKARLVQVPGRPTYEEVEKFS